MIKATVTAATPTPTTTVITTTAKFNVTLISQKVCQPKKREDKTLKFPACSTFKLPL